MGWLDPFQQVLAGDEEASASADLGEVWGKGTVFAVGDCNYGCIGNPPNWVMPPIPKISYPGEEQALHACNNIEQLDRKANMRETWWPWGAGMFATSLGPHDAC